MISELAGYLSGIFILLSFAPYIKDIFRGSTKPERASWLIWAILGLIAFFSQLAKGASDSLWLTGLQALGDIFVFLLVIKYGLGGWTRRDKIALVAAGISLILWYLTNEAAVALFIVIFIDGTGGVLTMLKAYERPKTETVSTWALTSLSGFLGTMAVGSWNFVLLAFPVYIFLISLAILIAIKLGEMRNPRPSVLVR